MKKKKKRTSLLTEADLLKVIFQGQISYRPRSTLLLRLLFLGGERGVTSESIEPQSGWSSGVLELFAPKRHCSR